MAKASAKRPILPMPLWMGVSCGIAVGLIVMMLPLTMLESIVEQTGLASVLPAAAPPLGQTARGLLAAICGLVMAVSCFVLLRALEGLPPIRIRAPRTRRSADEVIFDTAQPDEMPEHDQVEDLRRGPIMAARDLGAPFHSITAESAKSLVAPDIAPQPPLILEPPLVLEPEMVAPAPEPVAEWDEPVSEPAYAPSDAPDEIAPVALPEASVTVPEAIAPLILDREPGFADPAPIPVSPARSAIEGSIPALVRRLETGFERRLAGRETPPPSEPGFTDPQPDIDVALRDALGTLQRMSARSR